MVQINDNFLKLPGGYLFPEISRASGRFLQKTRRCPSSDWVSAT
jgi:hypothetical protein